MKKGGIIAFTVGGVGVAAFTGLLAVSHTTYLANEIHICEIDDLHGKIPGWGDDFFMPAKNNAGVIRLSEYIQNIVSKYPGSIVLAGGDQNSSGPFSTCTQGDTMYPVLSAMNIPYSVVGNHAWDFGGDKLTTGHFDKLGRTKDTVGNYFVTSNVLNDKSLQTYQWSYHESDPKFQQDYALWNQQKVDWADPYKLLNLGGHQIAFIGLTTQSTMDDGCQSELTQTCFIDYLPAISYTKYKMKQDVGEDLYNRVEAFVLYTHVPANYNSTTHEYTGQAVELAKNVDNQIDLILAAHSHQDIATKIHNDHLNKDIPLVEAKADGQSFADVAITFDNTKKEGKRLKDISVKTVSPYVPESKEDAAANIELIRKYPINDIVSNTIKEYDKQKEIAKAILNEDLATSNNGLNYDLEWGWHEDYNNIEPAGAYAAKCNIKGFELFYKDKIESGDVLKPSVSIISKDSIQQAIQPGSVKTRDIYGIYPFDNKPMYYTLTYHQLEQVVKYILSGASTKAQFNTDTYYFDDAEQKPVTLPDNLRFTYGPSQFYGFSFECTKLATPDAQGRNHQYKDGSLKIYDPNAGQDIDNPSTWGDKDHWAGKLIGCVMSNFNFNKGNKQYLMIGEFAKYNAQAYPTDTKAQIHNYADDLRQLPITYTKWLNQQGKTVDIDQSILDQLFKVVD